MKRDDVRLWIKKLVRQEQKFSDELVTAKAEFKKLNDLFLQQASSYVGLWNRVEKLEKLGDDMAKSLRANEVGLAPETVISAVAWEEYRARLGVNINPDGKKITGVFVFNGPIPCSDLEIVPPRAEDIGTDGIPCGDYELVEK